MSGRVVLVALALESGASAVFWNRRYDEAGRNIDAKIKAALKAREIVAESFNGNLLYEPWTVTTKSGDPFRIFTVLARGARARLTSGRLGTPRKFAFHPLPKSVKAVALADLHLLPAKPNCAGGLRETWTPGEAGAYAPLVAFEALA